MNIKRINSTNGPGNDGREHPGYLSGFGVEPTIGDLLASLIPRAAVRFSDAEIQRMAGLSNAELASLKAPTKDLTGMGGLTVTHSCGDPTDVNLSWEFAWTRSYLDQPDEVAFALSRRSRQGESCVLVEIPHTLREEALKALDDPISWRSFIECLPRSCFISWHGSVHDGLDALNSLRLVSSAEDALLENAAVHMRVAAIALQSAAGLLERVSDAGVSRQTKIRALVTPLKEKIDAAAFARPSQNLAGYVSQGVSVSPPSAIPDDRKSH